MKASDLFYVAILAFVFAWMTFMAYLVGKPWTALQAYEECLIDGAKWNHRDIAACDEMFDRLRTEQ